MRRLSFACGLALLIAGCAQSPAASRRVRSVPPDVAQGSTNVTVVPVVAITGKVVLVDRKGGFVVLRLAPMLSPFKDTRLFVYHNGKKTAELRISGPQQDVNTVADIMAGDPQPNDLVSDN